MSKGLSSVVALASAFAISGVATATPFELTTYRATGFPADTRTYGSVSDQPSPGGFGDGTSVFLQIVTGDPASQMKVGPFFYRNDPLVPDLAVGADQLGV